MLKSVSGSTKALAVWPEPTVMVAAVVDMPTPDKTDMKKKEQALIRVTPF